MYTHLLFNKQLLGLPYHACQICDALNFCHASAQLIHGDVT